MRSRCELAVRMRGERGMRVPAIGAGLRLERRLFHGDGKAEAADHLVEHVIVLITHPAIADLQRHVPIAQVIARAAQRHGLRGAHGRDGLGLSDDLHDAAIVGEQQISAAED